MGSLWLDDVECIKYDVSKNIMIKSNGFAANGCFENTSLMQCHQQNYDSMAIFS